MEKYLSTDGLLLTVTGGKLTAQNISWWLSSADYTDRSDMSFEEVSGGLARLIAGGLLEIKNNAVKITKKGKKVLSSFHCWLMGAVDYQLWVRERIQKEEYDESALPKEIYVTRELYDEAFKLYTDRWQRELEKMSRKHKK